MGRTSGYISTADYINLKNSNKSFDLTDKEYQVNSKFYSMIRLFYTLHFKFSYYIHSNFKNVIMGKFDRFCQSCGMPLEKEPNGGGTNADGTISIEYCSHCFEKGQFKDNFTTSKEMVAFCKNILKEQGYGFLKRWFYTSHIPQLRRWKK